MAPFNLFRWCGEKVSAEESKAEARAARFRSDNWSAGDAQEDQAGDSEEGNPAQVELW